MKGFRKRSEGETRSYVSLSFFLALKKLKKNLFLVKCEFPMCLVNNSAMAGIKKTCTYQSLSLFHHRLSLWLKRKSQCDVYAVVGAGGAPGEA